MGLQTVCRSGVQCLLPGLLTRSRKGVVVFGSDVLVGFSLT